MHYTDPNNVSIVIENNAFTLSQYGEIIKEGSISELVWTDYKEATASSRGILLVSDTLLSFTQDDVPLIEEFKKMIPYKKSIVKDSDLRCPECSSINIIIKSGIDNKWLCLDCNAEWSK